MDLRLYLESLWRRRWIIVVTVVVTVAITTVGTLLATPLYVASATLRVAQPPLGSLDYFTVNLEYSQRLMNTYVRVATSRPILEELRTRLGISWTPSVDAQTVFDTELIRITVEDADPIMAREAANTLAQILVDYGAEFTAGEGTSSKEILSEQLDQVDAELTEARAEYDALAFQVPENPDLVASAKQKVEVKEQTYARLLQLYDQARLTEAAQENTISIFETATTPRTPSQPKMGLDIALGFAVGLTGGVFLAIVFESLDTTLHTVKQVEDATQLPALGRISNVKGRHAVTLVDTDSLQGEELRRLYANILALDHDPAPRTILVTSTGSGEGKSFITANLAAVIAQTRRRVVVVDGDPWKPGLHEIYDLPNNVGLSSVLSKKTPLAEAVQESGLPGVHVLAAGPPLHTAPDELPQALQMAWPLEQLARDYDVVLLDTPAFQNVADAAMIASQVDGVLLVVGLGQAKREDVQATRQELARVRANVFGVVVNRCDAEAHAKYYKQAQRTTMGDAEVAAAPEGGPARILLVEDDPSLAKLMNTRLSRVGYEIRMTDNGQTALQIARRWKPDLVILDVVLSDNVDGFEVTQEIRRTRKLATVPIIMVTARVDYDAKLAGFGGGADDYITKPFDVDDLALRVAALLRRAQAGSEGQWPTLADPSVPVTGDGNGGNNPVQAADGGHHEGNPH